MSRSIHAIFIFLGVALTVGISGLYLAAASRVHSQMAGGGITAVTSTDSRAYTLQDELTDLIREKKDLQAELGEALKLVRRLQPGMSGDDVGRLQKNLNQLSEKPPLKVSNFFGPRTANALGVFQKKYHLAVSRVFDAATQFMLVHELATPQDVVADDLGQYPDLVDAVNAVASSTVETTTSTSETAAPAPDTSSSTASFASATSSFAVRLKRKKHLGKPPTIGIELASDWTKYLIRKDKAVVGTIPAKPTIGQIPAAPPTLYLQTDAYAYIYDGIGRLYRLDLDSNDFFDVTISGGDIFFADISPDEMVVAWTGDNGVNKQIILQTLETGAQNIFDVSNNYSQVGYVLFSPDGKKVAYAAGTVRYNIASGAVYIINIADGKQKRVAVTHLGNSYFIINGWNDSNSVSYEEAPIGGDSQPVSGGGGGSSGDSGQ